MYGKVFFGVLLVILDFCFISHLSEGKSVTVLHCLGSGVANGVGIWALNTF